MPGLRGGAPEQVEEEEGTYREGAEQEDFQQNINTVSKNATAITEHLTSSLNFQSFGLGREKETYNVISQENS
jgi:hypothetical protein